MGNYLIDTIVFDEFPNFCQVTPIDDIAIASSVAFGDPNCLMDFIAAWVQSGWGVRDTNANFTTYLTVVPAIINEWHKNPGITDYHCYVDGTLVYEERRVESIFAPNSDNHRALDQYWYDRYAFECMNPRLKAGDRTDYDGLDRRIDGPDRPIL